MMTEVLQKSLYTDFTPAYMAQPGQADKSGWHGCFKELLKIRVIGRISAIRVQKEAFETQLCKSLVMSFIAGGGSLHPPLSTSFKQRSKHAQR
jgi:hypothetical protein